MIKRIFDFSLSFVILILFSPVFLFLSFFIYFDLGKPVLFRQRRPGRNGQVFHLIKFRTMKNKRNKYGDLLPDDERLTSLGRFLRSTSLDELPSLWNVLKGDMSLVGPRPLLVEYLPLYTEEQSRRHELRPGLTGWAQINGRNSISWEKKFELDIWYIDNQSFWFDMKILFLTVKKVFIREGIHAEGSATIEKFKGSQL